MDNDISRLEISWAIHFCYGLTNKNNCEARRIYQDCYANPTPDWSMFQTIHEWLAETEKLEPYNHNSGRLVACAKLCALRMFPSLNIALCCKKLSPATSIPFK